MINSNIGGKCYNLIYNMYQNIKSCVGHNDTISELCPCNIGVRQGENLSPFLFAIYMNDLECFLYENNITGLTVVNSFIENQLGLLMKLFILLYADDTVLMAESAEGLQKSLNIFADYCTR